MITTRDLRVDYDGVTAVSDLSVTIEPGEVYGLIGPNGAGKTSTIRVLATLLEPTYGDVHIAGFDIAEDPRAIHSLLGYMPDNPPVYEDLRCWEFLDLFAASYFVGRRERRRKVEKLLDDVSLTAKRNTMAGTLSTGMRQRLVLAKTLMHDPQVLLLDEPASGLDPHARIELRELLKEQGSQGKTILVSSHILTELSGFCTSIGIMEKGRLVISGRIDEVVSEMNRHKRVHVEAIDGIEKGLQLLEANHRVDHVRVTGAVVEFEFNGSDDGVADILKSLIDAGVRVKSFTERRLDIEDIFMQVGAKEVS